MKNRKSLTNKKPTAVPTFCELNFSRIYHIVFIHTLLTVSIPCLEARLDACGLDQVEQKSKHLQQNMDKINMVYSRKISLAESWGSSRFFITNVFSVFHFDHF